MNNFVNREHLSVYLETLKYIGQGSQGVCYLNIKNNTVYKIFHAYYDDDDVYCDEKEILKFSNIHNDTFIWPINVVRVNKEIVGYTMPYVKARNFYEINPLNINLDTLKKAVKKTYQDILLITQNNVRMYDTTYNVMYTSGHIYVIDTIEYDYAKVTYLENRESIDELVKMFLVDNYFDYFVRDSKILSEMYDCKGVDSISFIEEFKNELSNYMGMEINTLNKAKSLVKRVNMPSYGRSIIKINY